MYIQKLLSPALLLTLLTTSAVAEAPCSCEAPVVENMASNCLFEDTTNNPASSDNNQTNTVSSEANQSVQAANLKWQMPTHRENGKTLGVDELGGYDIYITSTVSGEINILTIDNPQLTSLTFDSFEPGSYHFAISAFDNRGTRSKLSGAILVTLAAP